MRNSGCENNGSNGTEIRYGVRILAETTVENPTPWRNIDANLRFLSFELKTLSSGTVHLIYYSSSRPVYRKRYKVLKQVYILW